MIHAIQPFNGPLSANYLGEPVPEETFIHPFATPCGLSVPLPPSPSPPIFTPNALPAATLLPNLSWLGTGSE